jgi:DnaD/phage-associated family protein
LECRVNFSSFNSVFVVPSEIIDKHIEIASGMYFKVLLLVLKNSHSEFDTNYISKTLNIEKFEVNEALNYWNKAGIIDLIGTEIKEKKIEPVTETKSFNVITNKAPMISSAEIAEQIKTNKKISFLCQSVQRMFARPLTTTEQRCFVSLVDWAGIEVEVLLIVVEYCMAISKSNVKYIEKTAMSWAEIGIDTHDKAEEYLKHLLSREKNQTIVKSCFGISNRNLSSNEIKYIDIWFSEYNFDIKMIEIAYDKMVDQIGKVSFPYINTILKSWFDNQIKTPEQTKDADEKKTLNIKSPKTKKKETSFSDDAFEKIKYNIPQN